MCIVVSVLIYGDKLLLSTLYQSISFGISMTHYGNYERKPARQSKAFILGGVMPILLLNVHNVGKESMVPGAFG